MFAFACFRVPDGLSRAVRIIRRVAGLALIAHNWWINVSSRRMSGIGATASSLAAALVLSGVFEMVPHPMYSVGTS